MGKILLAGVEVDTVSGTIPESVFQMFQLTFAIITPALIVGAFAERLKFSAILWFMGIWLTVVYAPVAHWVWGGGWLGELGVLDFAGGTGRAHQRRDRRARPVHRARQATRVPGEPDAA